MTDKDKMIEQEQKKQLIELIGDVHPFYVETIAEALYNAGYRKIPYGCMVIDKKYATSEEEIEFFVKHNEEVRKDTAKEILQGMLNNMHKLTGCGVPYHVRKFIEDFAEKYGVEVEE